MIFYFSGRGHSISPPPYSHQQCLTLLPEMKYFSIRKKRNCKKSELRWGRYIKELQKRTEMRLNIDQTLQVCKNHCKKTVSAPGIPETFMNWCRISKLLKMGLCVMFCGKKIFSVSRSAKSKKSSDCVLRDGALITLLNWQVLKNTAGKSAAWAMVCHEICNNRWE